MNWWLLSAIVYVVFVYLWSYECIGYHNLGNSLLCWQMGYGCFKSWHFILLFSFIFFPAPALQLCSHWPDAVHVGELFSIDLSGFDTSSYVINWGETITVIRKRLMKHCLIPAELTWFAQHCSLLFPLFLRLSEQSRMELPSSSTASLYSPLFWSGLTRHFSLWF